MMEDTKHRSEPRAACAKCDSTNTEWFGRHRCDLECLDCGHVERAAGVPEHHRVSQQEVEAARGKNRKGCDCTPCARTSALRLKEEITNGD